jgi:hypothetical protein
MHGGAAGSGAPEGSRNGAWRHGVPLGRGGAQRRLVARLVREARGLVEAVR